jgi:acyl-CoA synthetase (NDP forming)
VDLTCLLHPASIAVVGATERHGSYGAQTLLNLEAIGFAGPVWGVNPHYERVHGRPCVPTLADLPDPVDAVVVAIPAAGVADVIEQAGARGCGGAVVYGAGFGEVAGGREHQVELVAAARRHDLPLCGPNGSGIVAMAARAALWGDALVPRELGHVALVSQSGNVAVNALSNRRGLRFHTVVSSGNQAVLSAADYVAHLAADEAVHAIAMYLEDDGDAATLCEALAACAETGTPVVVLKVGASQAGAAAAAAHTGALAGDQRVFRALIEEAGAVWAHDVHDLLELAKTLAVTSTVRARGGLAILTCSGGDSGQGADEAAALGLRLPPLADATVAELAARLTSAATIGNPLDYTATIWGDSAALRELVHTVGADPGIDQVLVFYDQLPDLEGAIEESWRAVREGIEAGAEDSPVATMVCSTLPELLDDAAAWHFAQTGVAAAAGLRTGMRCAAAMRRQPGDPALLRAIAAGCRALDASGSPDRAPDGPWLAEHETKAVLRARGIPVVEGRVVADEADARAAAAELGGAVVVKLSSSAVQHKGELGGVVLDLRSPADVADAYRRIALLAARHAGAVLVERMAEPGVELIVAARRDAVVPALVVGLGGVWTELLDDVAIVPLPASVARVEAALRRLRGAPLLTGARGRVPADLAAVAELAVLVGRALLELDLGLIELNPVLAGPGGALAVDAVARARSGCSASVEHLLDARAGGQPGFDRAVDETGPAVRQVRAGQ